MDTTCSSPLLHTQLLLKEANIDALLLRSTDQYFNEYVPEYVSARAFISGFKGSVGDALISANANLFVDGRYALQAKSEAPLFNIDVCHSHSSIEQQWLFYIREHFIKGQSIAYDPRTLNLDLYARLKAVCDSVGIKLLASGDQLIDRIMKERPMPRRDLQATTVPLSLSGQSTKDKIKVLSKVLSLHEVDAFLVVKLDDIAWLLNARSHFFPFQSTLPALAALLPDRVLVSPEQGVLLPPLGPEVEIVEEGQLLKVLAARNNKLRIGIDMQETSKAHEMALQLAGTQVKGIANPLAPLKAIKNAQELLNLRHSFRKADQVVHQTHNFVVQSYEKGTLLSEGQVDDQVKEQFTKSGANDLSFRPICAGGKNGAIIHYGTPHREQKIEPGSLFLLDTGAYYEGGYATDLTRTFLAGPLSAVAQAWQKEMFTLVLKASIRGLSARFRRGTLGLQLDALVRAPLWQASLDYAHGTGHGIGINVHEFPPRIGPTSTAELKVGHVFSIEPGIYIEGLGGVRIENLATVVSDPLNDNFLCVKPLTFCPLDKRLIERSLLDSYDMEFLAYFEAEWHSDAPMPNLPPARPASFAIGK